jgi:hypothetical protein
MRVVPINRDDAHAFIRRHHRHHKPPVGDKFAIGVVDDTETLCGVAVVGRPVARKLDDGKIAEITRVCTDGTRNACSMLYGACRRAALAMGYAHVITYTLPEEGGASLRAAGFRFDGEAGGSGRMWGTRSGREQLALGNDMVGGKWRWVSP